MSLATLNAHKRNFDIVLLEDGCSIKMMHASLIRPCMSRSIWPVAAISDTCVLESKGQVASTIKSWAQKEAAEVDHVAHTGLAGQNHMNSSFFLVKGRFTNQLAYPQHGVDAIADAFQGTMSIQG
jgi:hypothetical protein